MQEKKSTIFTPFERLENLRVKRDWTWDQLANCLNVNRSLFFHLKAGKTNLSKRVMFRLAQAETEAGITPPSEIEASQHAAKFREGKELTALLNKQDQKLLKLFANEQRNLRMIINECEERLKATEDQIDALLFRQSDVRFKKLLQPKNQKKEE